MMNSVLEGLIEAEDIGWHPFRDCFTTESSWGEEYEE